MKIYIAGLIADGGRLQPHEIAENCRRFDSTEHHLRAIGHEPVNPLKLHKIHPTQLEKITLELSRERLRIDLQILATCDAIYMLPHWHLSQGARLEFDTATRLGLQVFFSPVTETVPVVRERPMIV